MSALRQARRRSSLGLGPLTGRCRQRPPFRFCLAAMAMTVASDRGVRARLQLVTEQPRRRRGARSPERGRDARGRPIGSLRPDPIRRRRRHPFPRRAAGRVPARASEHMRVLKVLRRGNRERARRGRRRIVRARPRCDRRRRHLTRAAAARGRSLAPRTTRPPGRKDRQRRSSPGSAPSMPARTSPYR